MNLHWIETHMPPEWDWPEADAAVAHRRRALPPMPGIALVDVTMDQLRSMPDLELNAALAELKDSVVAASLDGFRISVPQARMTLIRRAVWDAQHPALRPHRSKRRRRRELARAPRNPRSPS